MRETMRQLNLGACFTVMSLVIIGGTAQAGVTPYNDKSDWLSAIGDPDAVTTIDFTGFPETTIITDQYEDQGVTFFGFIDTINHNPNIFPNDEWGLDGNGDINLQFERPIHWIAAEWPGADFAIALYRDNQHIFTQFFDGGPIVGNFAGVFSTEAFDTAILIDPGGEAAIDDLHYVIPAPGSIAPLLTTMFLLPRRKRSTQDKRFLGDTCRFLKHAVWQIEGEE